MDEVVNRQRFENEEYNILALDPLLFEDNFLMDSLMQFNENEESLIEQEREALCQEKYDRCKENVNSFINETCRNVINTSCQINDYPQQYQIDHQFNQKQPNFNLNNNNLFNQCENQLDNNNNLLNNQLNSQYQNYQLQNCTQAYYINQNTKSYLLNNETLIYSQPTYNPCLRFVSSQCDSECKLMEPPIFQTPPISYPSNQARQQRQPLSQIQNQFVSDDYSNYDESVVVDNLTQQTLSSQSTQNTSTQNKQNSEQNSQLDEPIDPFYKELPANLAEYFQIQKLNDDNNTGDQQLALIESDNESVERSLIENSEFIRMFKHSKIVCANLKYSPKQLIYLNSYDILTKEEVDSKMNTKELANQLRRIREKNRKIREIKCKNRESLNIGLREMTHKAKQLNFERRIKKQKQLILKLESKMNKLIKKKEDSKL